MGQGDGTGRATVDDALRRYLDAMQEVVKGNAEPMKVFYSHRDDVTMCGAWGGHERGWEQVAARWDWAAARCAAGPSGGVMHEVVAVTEAADMAYVIIIERRMSPGMSELRVTQVFRREHGEWKPVHRHADTLVVKQ
jgi:hypothetical protein